MYCDYCIRFEERRFLVVKESKVKCTIKMELKWKQYEQEA